MTQADTFNIVTDKEAPAEAVMDLKAQIKAEAQVRHDAEVEAALPATATPAASEPPAKVDAEAEAATPAGAAALARPPATELTELETQALRWMGRKAEDVPDDQRKIIVDAYREHSKAMGKQGRETARLKDELEKAKTPPKPESVTAAEPATQADKAEFSADDYGEKAAKRLNALAKTSREQKKRLDELASKVNSIQSTSDSRLNQTEEETLKAVDAQFAALAKEPEWAKVIGTAAYSELSEDDPQFDILNKVVERSALEREADSGLTTEQAMDRALRSLHPSIHDQVLLRKHAETNRQKVRDRERQQILPHGARAGAGEPVDARQAAVAKIAERLNHYAANPDSDPVRDRQPG